MSAPYFPGVWSLQPHQFEVDTLQAQHKCHLSSEPFSLTNPLLQTDHQVSRFVFQRHHQILFVFCVGHELARSALRREPNLACLVFPSSYTLAGVNLVTSFSEQRM